MYTATLAPVGHGILLAGATPPRGHRDFELYIVTPRVITTLEQLLRGKRRPFLIRVVDTRRRSEDGGSRI